MRAQLKVRTEYSFRVAYGPVDKVVQRLKTLGCQSAAITDRSSTFGHVAWQKACKKQGIKPIFGVELAFIQDVAVKERRQNLQWHTLLARSEAGLRELYATVEEATRHFHYVPRLPLAQLDCFSQDLIVLYGGGGGISARSPNDNRFMQLHPALNSSMIPGISVPVSDNYLIEPSNRPAYEILAGRNALMRPAPIHLIDEWDLRAELDLDSNEPFLLAERLAQECNVVLPQAQNVRYHSNKTLMELCLEGAKKRGLELNDIYMARLEREVKMIYDKEFTDYFFLVTDLIAYAKTVMLVGPARGSSCGSLACYLMGITDIDPLPHNLIFERFIDVTRKDLPDIDIDFQDDKREMVFDYLTEKYGADCVARLGTISKYKAKSAIGEAAKALDIPPWETTELKRSIIERLSGDSRSAFCIADTFKDIDAGKSFISKYPAMRICEKLEGHARHSGMHAAGVVITEKPLSHYVARDVRTNTVHIDKYDAVAVNLLKIDALGLRTLSVIEDCLKQIGWNNDALLALPLDDDRAFQVLRKNQYSGVFQFEGSAQQSVARRFPIRSLYRYHCTHSTLQTWTFCIWRN